MAAIEPSEYEGELKVAETYIDSETSKFEAYLSDPSDLKEMALIS